MSQIPDQSLGFFKDLGETARRNPISAALIGMGAVWLFSGAKSPARAGDLFRNLEPERVPDTANASAAAAHSTGSAAASRIEAVREAGARRAANATQAVSEFAREMPAPGVLFETARNNLAELFRVQPLALGAVGLAIGAGIAAALPTTGIEDEYLGEASDTLKSKAGGLAGQQFDQASGLVTTTVEAATSEANKQGLTMEDAKAGLRDFSNRAGRVIEAARDSALNNAADDASGVPGNSAKGR